MMTLSASFAPFCQPFMFAGPAPSQLKQRAAGASGAARRRVVVIGGGRAARSAIAGLRGAPVDIVMLDQRHGGLVQKLVLDQPDTTVLLGGVTGIDTARRCVQLDQAGPSEISYDKLVIATGAAENEEGDAADAIRQRMLLAFDYAESEPDPAERRRLLTFVVIGGGPIGVEMASSLRCLVDQMLTDDIRAVSNGEVQVVLVEAGPRLLPNFSEALSQQRLEALERSGVQVRLGSPATEVAADHVVAGGERIETRTAIWAAGADGSRTGSWLRAHADRYGRVEVTAELTVPGEADVFVIGAGARVPSADRRTLIRQDAADRQEGAYVARAIRLELEGRRPARFRYSWMSRLAASVARIAGTGLRLPRPVGLRSAG